MTRKIACGVLLVAASSTAYAGSGTPAPGVGRAAPAIILSHTPRVEFVSFSDPKEKAFTVEVPKGWSVRGGLFRMAAVDTRPAMEMTDPGGGIRITTGDAEIPTFTLPSQTLAFAGFGEGAWYSPGYGVRMMVRRYLTGAQFAEEYVRTRVLPAIQGQNAQIVSRQDRPDLSQGVNQLYRSLSLGAVRLDFGEVRFAGVRNGERYQGYYLAGTLFVGAELGGIWHVDHLAGYAAPRPKAPLAEAILLHIIRTARINPEWARRQASLTSNVSQIVAQTNSAISDDIKKTFEGRWKAESEIMRKDANMRRETTDLIDPDTGETWNVRSQSRYFWRKPGSDVIVGTEISEPPGLGFEPLRPY